MAFSLDQYAKSFYEAIKPIQEEDQAGIEKIVKNFINLLKRHHRLKDINALIKKIEYYWETDQKAVTKVKIQYVNAPHKDKVKNLLIEQSTKQITFEEVPRKKLIGGARIKIQDTLIDYSLRTALDKAGQALRNSPSA